MLDEVFKELRAGIEKAIEALRRDLSKVRTGRAHAGMLDSLRVDYYGVATPVSQMATVSVPEPRLITIKPWEKGLIKEIEKALGEANLGLTPMNDGELIRLPIPPLTEERRKDIAKQVRTKGEDHRVAVRNERRDANERLKALLKDKKISEDESKRTETRIQKETDGGIAQVDQIIQKKEKEVMEV